MSLWKFPLAKGPEIVLHTELSRQECLERMNGVAPRKLIDMVLPTYRVFIDGWVRGNSFHLTEVCHGRIPAFTRDFSGVVHDGSDGNGASIVGRFGPSTSTALIVVGSWIVLVLVLVGFAVLHKPPGEDIGNIGSRIVWSAVLAVGMLLLGTGITAPVTDERMLNIICRDLEAAVVDKK